MIPCKHPQLVKVDLSAGGYLVARLTMDGSLRGTSVGMHVLTEACPECGALSLRIANPEILRASVHDAEQRKR